MSKRIVGYVISHSGKPGGPWEAFIGGVGVATIVKKDRSRFKPTARIQAAYLLASVRQVHPDARILRLVRRERVVACPVHSHQIHGGEAEELRKGIEGLISDSAPAVDFCDPNGRGCDVIASDDLQNLLDRVDARDSLAHLELNTAEERAVVEAAMAWEHWANLPASESTPATFKNLRLAGDRLATNCAALRAKRGG